MLFQPLDLVNHDLVVHAYSAFGTGYAKAQRMSKEAWSIVVPRLLTTAPHDPVFQTVVKRVIREDKTLQQFCFLLFTTVVKVFDTAIHVDAPTWGGSEENVNKYALCLDVFQRIQALQSPTWADDRAMFDRSCMFLLQIRINAEKYRPIIELLMRDIETACKASRCMPSHLTVLGLGKSLAAYTSTDCSTHDHEPSHSSHQTYTGRATINQASANLAPISHPDTTPMAPDEDVNNFMENDVFFASLECHTCTALDGSPQMQGYQSSLTRTAPRTRPPQPTWTGASTPLRVPHPNIHSFRGLTPDVRYDSCGKLDHKAAQCDQLAITTTMMKWQQSGRRQPDIDATMKRWDDKYSQYVEQRRARPPQVRTNYLERNPGITDQMLEDQLNWDYFGDFGFELPTPET